MQIGYDFGGATNFKVWINGLIYIKWLSFLIHTILAEILVDFIVNNVLDC